MTTIRAFDGLLVKGTRLQTVVSPAYDSLTAQDRSAFSADHPQNYINVMHSPDEFPEDRQPTMQELLNLNASNLQKMLARGDFEQLQKPAVFLYRLTIEGHRQTALVCELPIDHYDTGKVLKHENTQSEKEDLLADYLEVVGAASSPVCLAYQDNTDINELVAVITSRTDPIFDFQAHDQVKQTLWQVGDEQLIQKFVKLFASVDKTYLTDGHHRFAAGSRYAHRCRSRNSSYTGEENFNYVLVALFPAQQLRILPFNRCVRDLNGLSTQQFLECIGQEFKIDAVDRDQAYPDRQHEFGMLVDQKWYRLSVRDIPCPEQSPVGSLDVTILQNKILSPILGIANARSDKRLDYVTGDVGLAGIEQRCRQGWAVGFACHPTSINELMRVAESGIVMPPKSTYFDPKMRSGIFLRLY